MKTTIERYTCDECQRVYDHYSDNFGSKKPTWMEVDVKTKNGLYHYYHFCSKECLIKYWKSQESED